MKTPLLYFILTFMSIVAFAQDKNSNNIPYNLQVDSVRLHVDGNNAYYQRVVKVDSNINENLIYIRSMQFMASKNFQQTYGYEEEGKLIYTTTQDLNINPVKVNDDRDIVEPYTVQFAITIDLKNGRYRYTIHNITFYLPTETGNRRESLFDIYDKANNKDSKRIARDAASLIKSFETYITTLTTELHRDIERKLIINNAKF